MPLNLFLLTIDVLPGRKLIENLLTKEILDSRTDIGDVELINIPTSDYIGIILFPIVHEV